MGKVLRGKDVHFTCLFGSFGLTREVETGSHVYMSSSFGRAFRITTWGESHGPGVGVVIDGCPPRIPLSVEAIQKELSRRRPGQNKLVTPRDEEDAVEVLSGMLEGLTLGTSLALSVRNKDHRSEAYNEMAEKFRPSHADFTYQAKYGIRAWAGGGRSSARETIGRVAAGAVAKTVMQHFFPGMDVLSWVASVKDVEASVDPGAVTAEQIESHLVRTPDAGTAQAMEEVIIQARNKGDSVGGTIETVVRGVPLGLGEPVFDKLDAELAHAMLSLPAVKGFEVGSGFYGTRMTGSEHNDLFYMEGQRVRTRTNRSGGIQGGMSNGEDILFRVAFKPTATIMKPQETVSVEYKDTELTGRGRHDACVLPRAVPIVEAMTWLVLCDQFLRQRGQCGDSCWK